MQKRIRGRRELEARCAIDEQLFNRFASLLDEMTGAIGDEAVATLERILIVNDYEVTTVTNKLIAAVEPSTEYVPSGRDLPRALALPLESRDRLSCVIVIAKSVVQGLTQREATINALSTVLEEILHTWVYTRLWQTRGFVRYDKRGLSSCDCDLFTTVSRMVDEYIVIRQKCTIVSGMAMSSLASGQEEGIVALQYGGDVDAEVEQGLAALKQTVLKAARHEMEIGDAWGTTVTVLYRGMCEPLARYAAYHDGALHELRKSPAWRQMRPLPSALAPFWRNTHQHLEKVFELNLAGYDESVQEIVQCLRAMLKDFGVTYRYVDDKQCWIDFRSGWDG